MRRCASYSTTPARHRPPNKRASPPGTRSGEPPCVGRGIVSHVTPLPVGLCLLATLSCFVPAPDHAPITHALINGRFWTGEPERPWEEALAVRDGRIVAVGTNSAIGQLVAGETEFVDLRRRLVLPGFIDTHAHLVPSAEPTSGLDLSGTRSRRALVARVRTAAASRPAGTWLVGHGWDQRLWDGPLPHRDWIDRWTPEHAVWLVQRDRQLGLANTLALRRAEIAPGVPGAGVTESHTTGRSLTGLVSRAAFRQLEAVVPSPSPGVRDRALDRALRDAAGRGVTTVHHVGSWEDLQVFQRAHASGRLTTRVYASVPLGEWLRLDHAIGVRRFGGLDGRGSRWMRVGAVHVSLDGSLAASSAAFETPFEDSPETKGRLNVDLDVVRQQLMAADRARLQVMVQAVGNRANRIALDLSSALSANNGDRDRRYRIEAAQHLSLTDSAQFADANLLATVFPFAALHDGRWIDRQVGAARAAWSFPIRSLIDAGTRVTFGSGRMAPVAPLDAIYAAVTRRTFDGLHPTGWIPEQRITVEDAIRAVTVNAAYAGFAENDTGKLTVGRRADLIVLDRDLLSLPPNDIPLTRVVLTMVDGRVVFNELPRDSTLRDRPPSLTPR